MSDVVLELWPAAAPDAVTVFVKMNGNRHKVDCPPLTIDPALLLQLVSGAPPPGVTEQVADRVSTWLLGSAVFQHLSLALVGAPFRLAVQLTEQLTGTAMADTPFELLEQPAGDFFLFKPAVRSIVHLLDKVDGAPNPAIDRSWPLRVTILRSNPGELGGAVPEAATLRDHIIRMATQQFGAGAVEVTMFSSEGGDPPVTWGRVADHLRDVPPDILVYLGHADFGDDFGRGGRVVQLQLEAEGDDAAVPLDIKSLRDALVRVPVVVLAGCLTAALIKDNAALVAEVPNWMRANQGLAQALVNSSSGVQIAIGMRYRLETTDANVFLEQFFASLLQRAPGDIEAAVAWARRKLMDVGAHPPRWSAPVIFRREADEPTFPFLATPRAASVPGDAATQTTRELAWEILKSTRFSLEPGGLAPVWKFLADAEAAHLARAAQAGIAVIAPARVYAAAGPPQPVTISLHGVLSASMVRGRVLISDPQLAISGCKASQVLKDSGFRCLVNETAPGVVEFDLRVVPVPGLAVVPRVLPPGPLFGFEIALGSGLPAVHKLKIEIDEIKPGTPVVGGLDAIVISPP